MHFQYKAPLKCNVLKSSIIFIVVVVVIVGCRTTGAKNIEFSILDSSTNITTLSGKDIKVKRIALKPENIYGSFTNILSADSFLICSNLRSTKLISIYSLKGDSLVTEVIQRGTASHEGLSVAGLSKDHSGSASHLCIYDITLGKLLKINTLKAIMDTGYTPENETTLSKDLKNMVSPETINDSLIIATTYTWDDNRYIYATNRIVKKVGKLPTVENRQFLIDAPNTKFPNKAYIFKAISIKHPVENKIAIFYCKTDRVEFYSNDSLTKTIMGPDKFGPKMQVTKLQSGFSIEDFDQTKYAYTSITYTQDDIYSLYSGTEKDDACSKRIFVFGWDGTFKEEILLDRTVCKISINPKTKTLYCYENLVNRIFSASLN